MIVTYYNRATGEAFACADEAFLIREVFDSGKREIADFDRAASSGFIQIRDRGIDLSTFDDPAVL